MKKATLCSLILVAIVLSTGCNKKIGKLYCTKTETSSDNLELKEALNITFKGNEVTNMSIYSEIEISGAYVYYVEDLWVLLKEQYVNLEGKKGITFSTNNTDNILSVTIDADLKQMDKDAKKELSIGNTKRPLKDVKKELELSGYTCE